MKTPFTKLFAILMLFTGIYTTASARFITDETRPVSGFTGIASSGAFNVHIKLDGTESLKISAPDDVINEIETIVEDGTLKLRFKRRNWQYHGSDDIEIYITAKSLSALVNAGSGTMKVQGTVNTATFKAVLSGSGTIITSVKAGEVEAVISGSGDIQLDGSAQKASLVISGSGNMEAKNLKTSTSHVSISGSGDVYINASEELNTSILGSGSVTYSGNATVHSSKLGSGSVTKIK